MQRGRSDHHDHVDCGIADHILHLAHEAHTGAAGRELAAPLE
jgi:hypothetical protein